jgi:hypothetical protein
MENLERAEKLIKAAFAWRDVGVSTVPCFPNSKTPMLTSWLGLELALPDCNAIRRWFRLGLANIAVISGTGQLQILDFDNPERYRQWAIRAGELANTLTETTGRGVHVFFKCGQPESKVFQECEAFGLPGHLCNTCPSIHPNGSFYQFLPHTGPDIQRVEKSVLFSLLSDVPGHHNPGPGTPVPSSTRAPGTDLVSRIKVSFPLVKYLEGIGVKLRPSGADFYLGKCPLHSDHNPSMWVNPSREIWGCYNPSCPGHPRGDVINLFAAIHHITTTEAIQQMARGLPR